MQIFLHQLDGSQTILEITENTDLNTLIASNNLINCRLIHQGENINTTAQLLTLNNNANLFVTADLDGGKKKKKKKVYTTKKKNKHIHKKTPGATLALYTVDGNFLLIQERATSPKLEKPAPLAAQESSWPNTGTDTIVEPATPPSRWTQKLLKRTNKS